MATQRSELEQRRGELTRSLSGLSENRAGTYRRNSDALALDRPEEMVRLAEDEVAADAAVRDVQRELRDLDAEIANMAGRGIGSRVARAFGRGRPDR